MAAASTCPSGASGLGEMPSEIGPQPVAPRDQLSMVREVSTKLLDLKIAKPPMFSGAVDMWPEYRFRMEAAASLVDLDALMHESIRVSSEDSLKLQVQTPETRARGKLL